MFSVMVLRPGGGYAHDTTGSRKACEQRIRDLAASNRRPKAITHLLDESTGHKTRVR